MREKVTGSEVVTGNMVRKNVMMSRMEERKMMGVVNRMMVSSSMKQKLTLYDMYDELFFF